MKQKSIADIAKKYTQYDMIQKYTKLPTFPEQRVKLLFHFLSEGSANNNQMSELFSLVTSLVQVGLDAHDQVENHQIRANSSDERFRQLSILAGDYLSSRFYQLLSQAGQIETVRRLSEAICEVNKLKMNLYAKTMQLTVTAEQYLQSIVEIRTRLFMPFTAMMEGKYRTKWPELLEYITRCEVITEELHSKAPHTQDSYAYWYLNENRGESIQKLHAHLHHILNKNWKQFVSRLSPFQTDLWVDELCKLCEPVVSSFAFSKLAEEKIR